MKAEKKLGKIYDLLADLFNNIEKLEDGFLMKYENIDVTDEQYLNDIGLLKYLNKSICDFLGKKND